jgi:hypothetical protein
MRSESNWRRTWVLACVVIVPAVAAAPHAMSDPATAQPDGKTRKATPHCEVAMVSPVSGHAECVKPPGAPVAPPPKRPDQKLTVKSPAT